MGRRCRITDEDKQKYIKDAEYLYERLMGEHHLDSTKTDLRNHFELIQAQYANVFLPNHKTIYSYLLDWAIGHTIKTTHEMIGRKTCRLSKRTIIRTMKDLIAYGLIAREKRGVKDSAFSTYHLLEYAEGEAIREMNRDKLKKPLFERRAKVPN